MIRKCLWQTHNLSQILLVTWFTPNRKLSAKSYNSDIATPRVRPGQTIRHVALIELRGTESGSRVVSAKCQPQ